MSAAIRWTNHFLDLDKRTHIMGILNVTPDSFADGNRFFDHDEAVAHALQMAQDGADIIDVGGESTRPYATNITADEEAGRVVPVIQAIREKLTLPISIDTYKADVAKAAIEAGASMINDVSAARLDKDMLPLAAQARVPLILMHMKGTPENMQDKPVYDHLVPEIMEFLKDAMERAVTSGVNREMIILDPGIGFGKTFDHNLQIIRSLEAFRSLERPILLGCSRKAFIGHILNKEPDERDVGTMAAVAVGILKGAQIMRVHNVKMAKDTVQVVEAIRRGTTQD